jgi:hypothetical protein
MCTTIPLSRGQTTTVSPEDFTYLNQIGRWRLSNKGYAVHYTADDEGARKVLYMHRLVMARILGHPIPPGMQVDHVDRNRRHNTRANLRLATRSQNQAHKGRQKNTALAKGISRHAGKYQVRLRYYGQRLHLGSYATLAQAQQVYATAHRLLWGEFTTEADVPACPAIEQFVRDRLAQHGIDPSNTGGGRVSTLWS